MYIPNPERVRRGGTLSGLTAVFIHSIPELSLRSNSGLKLANAFGVFCRDFNLTHYRIIGTIVFQKFGGNIAANS
jgi:hypothetical protein